MVMHKILQRKKSEEKKMLSQLPVTICSLCRAGQRTDTPLSSSIQRSRPTSAPSNTGGGSDATPAVLRCMPETFPGPADTNRLIGFATFLWLPRFFLTDMLYQYSQMWSSLWAAQFLPCRRAWERPLKEIIKVNNTYLRGASEKKKLSFAIT